MLSKITAQTFPLSFLALPSSSVSVSLSSTLREGKRRQGSLSSEILRHSSTNIDVTQKGLFCKGHPIGTTFLESYLSLMDGLV